jgi:chloramphenicol-sensitive protein RarD
LKARILHTPSYLHRREDKLSKGIALSVTASVLFAVMYYYTSLLAPLSGVEIFGWRMLLTVPCMTVYMVVSGEWKRVVELVRRVIATPKLIAGLVASSALLGVQLWLFMWAPLNGYSLDVSLGYFLLPLTMVLTGRIAFGERLSYLQKVAVVFACLGVINELYQVGGFSWATLLVCIGYPTFFVLRKRLKSDNLGGLWLDMALTLPVAFWLVQSGDQGFAVFDLYPWLSLLIPLLGVISAAALVVYIIASRLLPFSLFGLLSYVEPVLLLGVALLLGESIKPGEWLTYIPIWMAVLVLVFEGFKHLMRHRRP